VSNGYVRMANEIITRLAETLPSHPSDHSAMSGRFLRSGLSPAA
jgi:hypothetical protein